MTKTYPKLNIRVSAELKAACDAAGPERVRELLSVLIGQPAPSTRRAAKVVGQTTPKPELSHKEQPKRSWADAIAANEAKLAAKKAAEAKRKAEIEERKRLMM